MYTANNLSRKSFGLLRLATRPLQRSGKRIDPGCKVITHTICKAITLAAERENSYQTDAATREEVPAYVVEHCLDAFYSIRTLDQWFKNMLFEPLIDLNQHGFRHFLFASWEKVINAALTQFGAFADASQARPLEAVGSEYFP